MKRSIVGLAALAAVLFTASIFAPSRGLMPAHAVVPSCGPMDVVFVIDDTGSMGGAIANVQTEAAALIADINVASGGDFQLGLVTFKDAVEVDDDLAAGNSATVTADLLALSAAGGAGGPEASDESLNTVINGLDVADRAAGQQIGDFDGTFRAGAVKIAILITDAPPGGFDDTYTVGIDDVNAHTRALEAAAAGILISAIFVPTTGDYAGQAAIMADYAATTGGVFVTTAANGKGTADAIADIIAECGGDGDECVDHEGNLLRWCLERDVVQPGPTATPAPTPTPHSAPIRWSR